jgi:signal transduction histidine kinase/ligand-binding sensor domain-containing protein/CheY-like chemotaxis protein/HPt (histidine-containing phosphotransfer) domain-containing protein
VYAVLQDSQGLVWLGTEDGLVRYDGHDLVRYGVARNGNGGLPGNFIQAIEEDAAHDLWIAIKDAGVARWSRSTDRFTVYRHDPQVRDSLGSDAVRTVAMDVRGKVWIGSTDAGIDILEPTTRHVVHLRHDGSQADSLIDDRVHVIVRDRSGAMWIGTESGLDRTTDGRAFTHYRLFAPGANSSGSVRISAVLEDRTGSIWVGTFDGGVSHLSPSGELIHSYRHDPRESQSLGNDNVHAMLEDGAGRLWIGTEDGLELLDRATGRFIHYRHDEHDPGSLRDAYVISLYEDVSGLVWIGTRSGGVSRWNPRSWELGGHRPDWLNGRQVTSFADAGDSQVWIGLLGGGLVRFNPASGESTPVDEIVRRPDALGDRRVMSLLTDRQGVLWIGTMTSGLRKLMPDARVETVPVRPGDPGGVSAPGIMNLFESRNGNIWIGTHGGGANVFEPATGHFRQLAYQPDVPGAVSSRNVTAFAEDARGNIWIGTDGGGLDLAKPDGTVVRVFRHDPADAGSLSANTIYSIGVDHNGHVWVGTDGGGLDLVRGSSDKPALVRFENLSRADGLSSDTIYGVLPDAAGRLWLSGTSGLTRLDPQSREIKTFHVEQGLQGEEFNSGAFQRLRDGRLCFGGAGGFNLFDPARLTDQTRSPRIALMRIEVLGLPLRTGTPYWLTDRVAVDAHASILSFDFGLLDFVSPKRNRLSYRVSGLTDNWINMGSQHRITLTNLDAGDHVLEVRAASPDSAWSSTPLRLHIHRDPVPWRSPWAYSGYALTALALLAMPIVRHRRRLREALRARQLLEAEVAARTQDLVTTNRLLEQAAQVKSDFLARMTHELRTPMNGVVGMTELLERTPLSADQARLTKTIRSSAKVLLQIFSDLLDLSKAQAGKVQLESVPMDLAAIVEESAALFAGAAAAKGVDITVCPPPANVTRVLVGDPLRLRQILLNLIGNAVKFTAQGEIIVTADLAAGTEGSVTLELTVSDTGIGMTPATIARIFEPFTQADESTSRRFGGTGLGLAICRELADLMGGTIRAESQPDAGSKFYLRVPLQLGTERATELTPLPQAGVRILTARPALAEALARHARAFGLAIADSSELVIIELARADAASLESFSSLRSRGTKMVVIASPTEADSPELRAVVSPYPIVGKPVQRDALYQALAGVLGVESSVQANKEASTPAARRAGVVLLVEDEPVNAAVAQGYLAALGCTCVWVESGAAALERSGREAFDLILMDVNMPGMDGLEAAALIRRREGDSRRIPIIALTAHDAAEYRDLCLAAGMDDLLTKPYTLEACDGILQRWLPERVSHSEEALTWIDPGSVAGIRRINSPTAPDLYGKLADLFGARLHGDLAELRAAIESGDLSAAARTCHRLKSSAANIGAVAFSMAIRKLERLCTENDVAGATDLFTTVAAAHPGLLRSLQDMRKRA